MTRHIEMQDTQLLPIISPTRTQKLSLKELRLSCRMSREQLSQAAGVRLCRVDWMERGIEASLSDALKVLLILSRAAHSWYHIEDIYGLRIKEPSTDDPAITGTR